MPVGTAHQQALGHRKHRHRVLVALTHKAKLLAEPPHTQFAAGGQPPRGAWTSHQFGISVLPGIARAINNGLGQPVGGRVALHDDRQHFRCPALLVHRPVRKVVDEDSRELVIADAGQQSGLIPQACVGQLRDLKGLDVERPIIQRQKPHEFVGEHRAVRRLGEPLQVSDIVTGGVPRWPESPFQSFDRAIQRGAHQHPGLQGQEYRESGA